MGYELVGVNRQQIIVLAHVSSTTHVLRKIMLTESLLQVHTCVDLMTTKL